MTEKLSASAYQRRERMLDAAEDLLLRWGLRGTTMEAIAREAQVAKPTLYGYFPDKEAVFAAVAERLFARLRQIGEAAFAGEGDATARAIRALSDKHVFVYRLLANSPHAEELSGSSRKINGPALADLDAWIKAKMIEAFADEGREDAEQLAELLLAAADGIARHAKSADAIEPAIRHLAGRLTARDPTRA